MPEAPLTPDKRRIEIDPDAIDAPPRSAFVELGLASCFSFLRGASDAVDLVLTARTLGYDAIGIADANSMAGVVRIHSEAKTLRLRPVIGCRIETVEGLTFLAYPTDRAAYGRLCRLISAGRMQTLSGDWQDKGVCEISLPMLAEHAEGVQLIAVPPRDLDARFTIGVDSNVVPFPLWNSTSAHPAAASFASGSATLAPLPQAGGEVRLAPATQGLVAAGWASRSDQTQITVPFPDLLPHLTAQLPTLRHIAASYLYTGDDIARIERLDTLARANGLSILATNDVLYHVPERRPLQDVMTAIRHKATVARAGLLLEANAERHLKSPQAMVRLFDRWPHAIAAAREVADACRFSLDELQYEYPEEIYPEGRTPQEYLEELTWQGARGRYPSGIPETVRDTLVRELAMIAKLGLARYFLTIKDIVDFARGCDPP
ncbi:MAG: PHP domain-containing protein, partial [Novosphingobium sp.]|nr:PHP domain-containing protein [Novosphingobium sp.]